jgi:type I restriction-modification system DNA methylase subunit
MIHSLSNDARVLLQESLAHIKGKKFVNAARDLFATLGYKSERRIDIVPNTPEGFASQFAPLNIEKALTAEWQSVDFLFQLTDEEIGNRLAFSKGVVDNTAIESYIFLAIQLKGMQYSRTRLAGITREINRIFPMPVMILFRHGDAISLSVIDRELNRRDSAKDVLRKVTLIKDIRLENPARAHIDILYELSLPVLYEEYQFRNFVALHHAWAKKLDSKNLSKEFYQDISFWYLWAKNHPGVKLPRDVDAESDEQRSIFFIRLLTRLIFCWFLQEKGLIPRRLFLWNQISGLLKDKSPSAGTYYKAILQNLFFATLNQEIDKRSFRDKATTGQFDKNRGVTTLYRYEDLLSDRAQLLALLSEIPFVNGGLFDCLDDVYRKAESQPSIRLDGFSDNPRESVSLPNELFFGPEQRADLSKEFDDERKAAVSVRPLIEILARYKFTVEENTPLEQEIALDPELLGKVFENLLASYNDDTKTIARKKLGAFYTPRDVVRYMVDEALVFHFEPTVSQTKLRALLSDQADNPCNEVETQKLIAAIEKTRILDPACGSGAFPMGALHRLVYMLSKLDPNNIEWKHRQLEAAKRDRKKAESMEESGSRETAIQDVESRIKDIETSFDTTHHDLDYARKLYLIENSIFGVDIQPIACQIAKLRFFISLLVDQKSEKLLRPLPNLETRIVAANTLIPVEKATEHQLFIGAEQVNALREELRRVRHAHFNARTPEAKQRYREQDEEIRAKLSVELEHIGMPNTTARLLASWNPYDQNSHASFFDPEWMFSLSPAEFTGFDIVIGNPPYVRQEKIKEQKPEFKRLYDCFSGAADLYVYFYERGIQLLNDGGVFSFITSNKWMRSGYGEKLRDYLKSKTRIRRMIDFGDAEIFDAIAYPCIVILENRKAGKEVGFKALKWNQDEWKVEDVTRHLAGDTFQMSQADLAADAWRLESKIKLQLLDRIKLAGSPLGEYVRGRVYRGILTGLNDAFVVSRGTRDELVNAHPSSAEVIKPFLRGRDIKRWQVEFEEQYLIRIESSENVQHPWSGKPDAKAEKSFSETYPAIYAFMKSQRKELKARCDQGKYYWELRSCAYWEEFEQPKIIVPAITDTVNFAPDLQGYYCNNKATIFIPESVLFTCAVVNSQVSAWFATQTFATKQGGFFDFEPRYSTQLVIPRASLEQQGVIERVAKCVIDHHTRSESVAFFERLLNGMVYELFFPEELHALDLQFFDLLASAGLPKTAKQSDWEAFHEKVSDVNHPIYAALFALNGLEVVRIIEGRE